MSWSLQPYTNSESELRQIFNQIMNPTSIFTSILIHFLFFFSLVTATISDSNFIKCLSTNSNPSTSVTNILYSPQNTSYSSVLEFSIQNLRFSSSSIPKPQFIITPLHVSHIQAAVICSKQYGLSVRVRSGGHDYSGLSSISYKPFVIIDLVKFQEIVVNVEDNSAWVQAGATIGQVYYRIAEKSSTLAFPAGVCTTVGVGGHIAGGGLGFMWRKYGLAADNILDAYFVDVNGKFLDRKSMGEDLFWAIRGGGGASFGVIVSWKIKLVPVPKIVTVFNVLRTLEQGATNLFYIWQNSAHKFHEDLQIRTRIAPLGRGKNKTIQVTFQSLFLGTVSELLPLMATSFPELRLEAKDCTEMSWINSTLYIQWFTFEGHSIDVLLNRSRQQPKNYVKGKSDFVRKAISITELEGMWKAMLENDISPIMINEPMGGKMNKIAESATPFPHRIGNLYTIQYYMSWKNGSASKVYLDSVTKLYRYMTPYVSSSPRATYLNYKDLDLGSNKDVNTSYMEATVWGEKYFKSNFARLACVKSKVDPGNFFWDEQSIPPFCPTSKKQGKSGLQ